MAGVAIHIDLDDRALMAALARLADYARDLQPVFQDMGEYLVETTKNRFDAGADPQGQPWEELSALTWLSKKHTKTLVESGTLMGSIIWQADPSGLDVGSAEEYSAIHQFGGTILPRNFPFLMWQLPSGQWIRVKRSTIPARPYLGLSRKDREEVAAIVTEHIEAIFA